MKKITMFILTLTLGIVSVFTVSACRNYTEFAGTFHGRPSGSSVTYVLNLSANGNFTIDRYRTMGIRDEMFNRINGTFSVDEDNRITFEFSGENAARRIGRIRENGDIADITPTMLGVLVFRRQLYS